MPPWSHRFAVVVSRLSVLAACTAGMSAVQAGTEPVADPMATLRERLAARLSAVPVPPSAAVGVLKAAPSDGLTVASAANVAQASSKPAQRMSALATRAPATAASTPAQAVVATPLPPAPPWAYEGEHGPTAWASLAPEYAACAQGQRQSPIDITDGLKVDLDAVQFDYRPSAFRVVDTGRTVQVDVAPGNRIDVMGQSFELTHVHFHRPSEVRIGGKPFDMGAHLIHQGADGKLAVVAVLLERGSAQPVVQAVWNNLPLEPGDEVAARGKIDLTELLPSERRYYTYMGSLTSPPCREGVLWMVMKAPVQISPEQLGIFARLYPMNARPIQALHGRRIKESN